ncbi:MAG: hypothetical protein WDM96_11445 [Lacunisphaera sp.]
MLAWNRASVVTAWARATRLSTASWSVGMSKCSRSNHSVSNKPLLLMKSTGPGRGVVAEHIAVFDHPGAGMARS